MKEIIVFLLCSTLLLAACETIDTISITDLNDNPAAFNNRTVTVVGTLLKGISAEKNEYGGHYTAYLKDFQDRKIRLECENLQEMGHNKRYLVQAVLLYNNKTKENYLKCVAPAVER